MGTQRVVGTKQNHTMQLVTESKAVEKETFDHEMDNDSPQSERRNLQPSPQKCK